MRLVFRSSVCLPVCLSVGLSVLPACGTVSRRVGRTGAQEGSRGARPTVLRAGECGSEWCPGRDRCTTADTSIESHSPTSTRKRSPDSHTTRMRNVALTTCLRWVRRRMRKTALPFLPYALLASPLLSSPLPFPLLSLQPRNGSARQHTEKRSTRAQPEQKWFATNNSIRMTSVCPPLVLCDVSSLQALALPLCCQRLSRAADEGSSPLSAGGERRERDAAATGSGVGQTAMGPIPCPCQLAASGTPRDGRRTAGHTATGRQGHN